MCNDSDVRRSPVQIVNGLPRLLTPAVQREAKQHFNCQDVKFGPALQKEVGTGILNKFCLRQINSHPSFQLNGLLMYCCLFDCVISLCREACYLFEMDTSCMPLYFIVFVFFVGRYSISLEQIPDVWIHYDTQPWPSEYLIFNHSLYALYNSEFCSF